jgi:diguanylate cyclase (GGDEF)-like protein
MALVLLGSFMLLDHSFLGQHYPQQVLWLDYFVVMPLLLLALAISFYPALKRHTVCVACAAMIVTGLAFAWTNPQVLITPDRPAYGFESLIIFIAFIYFFSGAMFHSALAIALAITVCFMVAIISSAASITVTVYCIYFLLAINLVSAVARYMLDKTYRRNYLTRMLAMELAERDSLTGVYNRRAYETRLDVVLRQARRERHGIAVAALDVDYFKRINDAGGHPLGDEVLRLVGDALTATARRPLDCVARLGGDEFSAVWFGIKAGDVATRVEELQQNFAARIAILQARCAIQPTLSIGIAFTEASGHYTAESLQQAADNALYRAKSEGRNRVVVDTQSLTTKVA